MVETTPNPTASPQRRPGSLRRLALLIAALISLIFLHWLLFQGQEIVPGVIARPVGPCDVEWFEQWGGTIVIACPRTDLIKVWPLPVQQPWYEDTFFEPETAMRISY